MTRLILFTFAFQLYINYQKIATCIFLSIRFVNLFSLQVQVDKIENVNPSKKSLPFYIKDFNEGKEPLRMQVSIQSEYRISKEQTPLNKEFYYLLVVV